MTLSAADFDFVRQLVSAANGNVIGDDKAYLVETRLLPLAHEAGFRDLSQFLNDIRRGGPPTKLNRLAEAMLVTETYFFREPQTLDHLSDKILPALLEQNSRPIKIWSAACSSGQEVYSLALQLAERSPRQAGDVCITGSDVSPRMLDQARRAEYSTIELDRNLPERHRRLFLPQGEGRWRLTQALPSSIRFEPCNLVVDVLPGPWDVVLLRNVLIYFSDELRQAIIRRICSELSPGGWLILGNSETSRPPAGLFHRPVAGVACFQRRSEGGRSRTT